MEKDLKKKKALYEKLGAKRFKKIVFKVESLKWKFIKKFMPNYKKNIEKIQRKERDKLLSKAKTKEEKDRINNQYIKNTMLMRREYNTELNSNYHIDINNPNAIIEKLNNNKRIHINWLKFDAVSLPVLLTLFALGHTWTIPFMIIVILEAIKNFECVNLQNYSLVCYEEKKEKLKKIAKKNIERKKKKYGEAQDVITKVISESEEVPSLDKVIQEAKTKESVDQLFELLLKEQEKRMKNKDSKVKIKQKEIGG